MPSDKNASAPVSDLVNAIPAVFCAIDTPDIDRALALAADMGRAGCGLKLGLEFFGACGPEGVQQIARNYPEARIFLDLKFHDIPNTVAGACRSVTRLEPAYLNVHASGGAEMMRAARDAVREEADKTGIDTPRLLAVTILTSLDENAIAEAGYQPGVTDRVKQMATLARQAGLDGIVCAAHEIETLREICGPDFVLMVPGIRPTGSDAGDQKRTMTPHDALRAGATHLVIGRPITGADDPHQAAAAILADL